MAPQCNKILLLLMVPLSVFTSDLYLASFEELGGFFKATPLQLQWTLSGYFIALALFSLLCALFCNIIGSKRTLLITLASYIIGTCCCLFTGTIGLFILGRCLQACGAAGTSVIARTLAKRSGPLVSTLSAMLFVVSVSLCLAPLLGGAIQTVFGWQGNFIFLAFLSFFYFCGVLWLLGEEKKSDFQWKRVGSDVWQVLKTPSYVFYTLLSVILWMGFISFVSGAPCVFLSTFKLTPLQFGVLYALAMTGFVSGTLITYHYSTRYRIGSWVLTLASLFFIIQLYTTNLFFLSVSFFLYLFAVGLLLSIAQASAVEELKEQSAYGFGVMLFCMMLMGGGCGLLIHSTTAVFHALLLLMSFLGFIHGFLFFRKEKRRLVIQT